MSDAQDLIDEFDKFYTDYFEPEILKLQEFIGIYHEMYEYREYKFVHSVVLHYLFEEEKSDRAEFSRLHSILEDVDLDLVNYGLNEDEIKFWNFIDNFSSIQILEDHNSTSSYRRNNIKLDIPDELFEELHQLTSLSGYKSSYFQILIVSVHSIVEYFLSVYIEKTLVFLLKDLDNNYKLSGSLKNDYSDIKLTYSDIFKFNNLDEIKKKLSKDVAETIAIKSFYRIWKFMFRYGILDNTDEESRDIKGLIHPINRIFAFRNAIVHNNGIIDSPMMKNLADFEADTSKFHLGKELNLTKTDLEFYIEQSKEFASQMITYLYRFLPDE